MNAIEFLNKLKESKLSLFHTGEVALLLEISTHSAGKYLETLRQNKFLEKIGRARWVLKGPNFDSLCVAEFITAPRESYISLQSALFHHGMIEQVPSRTYSVTVDRSKVIKTPVGVYSFHHCDPKFFIGYEYIRPFLKIASPEKSLVDYFYFSPTKSRQFTKLPELELSRKFSWKRVEEFCRLIPSTRLRTLVRAQISDLTKRRQAI